MKTLLYIFLFLNALTARAEKNIILSLGESHALKLKDSPTVWIQNREILKAEGIGSNLLLKAQKEGRTTVKIGTELYRVQVLHPIKENSLEDFRRFLSNKIGLSVQVLDGDLQVQGTLYRLQDWIQLAEFARTRSLTYKMNAQISSDLKEQVQDHFRKILTNSKLPPQTIIFEPTPEVRLKSSDLNFQKYQELFSTYGIQIIKDESSLEIAPTVKVEITVMEIKKSLHQTWGLLWPEAYAATLMPDGGWFHEDIMMKLHALENSGDGKILASPNILCRSGQEAEFLAGGEFPIKVSNFRHQEVLWKRYGILLRVKPRADAAGRISLSIETEITTLDHANAVEGIPGVLTNRVSSHFDLSKPQTIALSGLLKNENGESSSGLPWLSRLPVLGALFSSKDFKENRSELVIFVRPTILKEDSESAPRHLTSQGI